MRTYKLIQRVVNNRYNMQKLGNILIKQLDFFKLGFTPSKIEQPL